MTRKFISPTDLNTELTTNLTTALNTNTPLHIFDVRKRPAFNAKPQLIPSATWQIHDRVNHWAKEIPANANVVVYCVHGHEVSQNTAQQLRDLGFKARYLQGGFDEWKTQGFELVKDKTKGAE